MTCESCNNSEESPQPRERGAKLAQVYFVLRTKSNEMFSNRFQTLGCTPGSERCFRDPVLGWGKQEGRGLFHIRKSSNNPEESPHVRERGAKLAQVCFCIYKRVKQSFYRCAGRQGRLDELHFRQLPPDPVFNHRTPNIELRDLIPDRLEGGIVPEVAGATNNGCAAVIVSHGGINMAVHRMDVNDRTLQLVSKIPSPRTDSTRGRRNLNVLLLVSGS
jgi:hypothetical protein